MRDLTRRRKKLLGNLSAEKNRIQKVLETANVKIGNIVSDVFGVSGQAMVKVLISGCQIEVGEIAELSKHRLRKRIPELTEALKGHQMNEHHRWLIRQSVEHAVLLDQQLEELEVRIEEKIKPWKQQYELLQTIPGVKSTTAATILAEVGPDMSQFEDSGHLSSWAGIYPGNNRSAGKRKSSRIKKGNRFLLTALVQAAWAAARKKDSIFQRKFHRWMKGLGEPKANVALAHNLLEVVYAIVKTGRPWQEPDPAAIHEREKEKLIRHHAKRLTQLGADDAVVAELAARLRQLPRAATPTGQEALPQQPDRIRRTCPAKVCRGALGFRARQTRPQEYSVKKEPLAGAPRQRRPSKTKNNNPSPEY